MDNNYLSKERIHTRVYVHMCMSTVFLFMITCLSVCIIYGIRDMVPVCMIINTKLARKIHARGYISFINNKINITRTIFIIYYNNKISLANIDGITSCMPSLCRQL